MSDLATAQRRKSMPTRWLATDFGGPDVLELVSIELGPPKAGEVTIEVRAAGMNPADYKHFASDRGCSDSASGSKASGGLKPPWSPSHWETSYQHPTLYPRPSSPPSG
jgi:hypothetical protein